MSEVQAAREAVEIEVEEAPDRSLAAFMGLMAITNAALAYMVVSYL